MEEELKQVIGMDLYENIRKLYVLETSKREIARKLGISRNTVRKYCKGEHIPGEKTHRNRDNPVLTDEVKEIIKGYIREDEAAPRKQQHTSRRIHRRLVEEHGFKGGESTVRAYVAELKRQTRKKVFLPLAFSPGEAMQVDWGEFTFYLGDEKTRGYILCFRLCHSCAIYVRAFARSNLESFLEGHVKSFNYFGGVPRTLIYDNLKTAVKEGWGKHAKVQDSFLPIVAHYAFDTRFCNVASGNEKGLVENLVGYARRNCMVPVPRVASWEELNEKLQTFCNNYMEHRISGRERTVGSMYEDEKGALIPLPVKPFEASIMREAKVDYYSTVHFDRNRYSVPVTMKGRTVTLKGSAFRVEIYCRGERIADHERLFKQGGYSYRLEHYIPLLERRPGAVNNAIPVREHPLRKTLKEYAKGFENPDKAMVNLLTLSQEWDMEQFSKALEEVKRKGIHSLALLREILNRKEDENRDWLERASPVFRPGPSVRVVEMADYDLLLRGGN